MNPTTQTQIQDYLQWSGAEYEDFVLKHYWSWCHKYSTSPRMLQCYLASAAINNYFMTEWQRHENTFLSMLDSIPKTPDRLLYHYYGCVVQVYNNYPIALFESQKPKAKQEHAYSLSFNQHTYYAN